MARFKDAGFEIQPWMHDQENLDPLVSPDMDVDTVTNQKRKPAQLAFGQVDSFFSDPWAEERPLTPLDHNVPRWFQRRKVALVPDESLIISTQIPTFVLGLDQEVDRQHIVVSDTLITKSLRRVRSHVDMADRCARDSVFFDQYSPCGQAVNELIKSPAVQTLLSRKRKVDSCDLSTEDWRAPRKRKMSIPHSCNYESTIERELGLTSMDFYSWNFGFDVHIATAGMC